MEQNDPQARIHSWVDGWMDHENLDQDAPPSPRSAEFSSSPPAQRASHPPKPRSHRVSPYPATRPAHRHQSEPVEEEEPEEEFIDTTRAVDWRDAQKQAPFPPPELRLHRQTMLMILRLERVRDDASVDENGFPNSYFDPKTRQTFKSLTVPVIDELTGKKELRRFFWIQHKWIRYELRNERSNEIQIYNPRTKQVQRTELAGINGWHKWFEERGKASSGNAFSMGHRKARIYGIDEGNTEWRKWRA